MAMVVVVSVPLIAAALAPATDVAGTDLTASEGRGVVWRIAYCVLSLVFLVVPVAVVVVARKKWLGWVLVLLSASVVIFSAGLYALGIL